MVTLTRNWRGGWRLTTAAGRIELNPHRPQRTDPPYLCPGCSLDLRGMPTLTGCPSCGDPLR